MTMPPAPLTRLGASPFHTSAHFHTPPLHLLCHHARAGTAYLNRAEIRELPYWWRGDMIAQWADIGLSRPVPVRMMNQDAGDDDQDEAPEWGSATGWKMVDSIGARVQVFESVVGAVLAPTVVAGGGWRWLAVAGGGWRWLAVAVTLEMVQKLIGRTRLDCTAFGGRLAHCRPLSMAPCPRPPAQRRPSSIRS